VTGLGAVLRSVVLAVLTLWLAQPGQAQELEPQRWRHLPIDTNFLSATYIHTDGEIALDPLLGLTDARSSIDTWALAYARTFELFGKSAQFRVLQPWQVGAWDGTLDGASVEANREGLADTEVRFAIHLLGAPPLEGKEYAAYRASIESEKSETLFGVAFAVQLPTGEYKPEKLINLGSNQFVFRPEIGFVHARGPWSLEVSGIASLYSTNDSYFNGNRLEIDPLYFAQANLLYRFRPDLWAAAGAGYAYGGPSTVNGIENDDERENILWGFSAGYAITPRIGITLKYIRSDSQKPIGTDSNRYIVSLSTFW
jgi:hypothetical protein